MSLESELQEINGVGKKTAEKIMTVFENHSSDTELRVNLEKAIDYYEAGEYQYAGKFLRRAKEDL